MTDMENNTENNIERQVAPAIPVAEEPVPPAADAPPETPAPPAPEQQYPLLRRVFTLALFVTLGYSIWLNYLFSLQKPNQPILVRQVVETQEAPPSAASEKVFVEREAPAAAPVIMPVEVSRAAVVDFERVKRETQVYQSILGEQKKQEEQLQKRLAADIAALQKKDKELVDNRPNLSAEDYQKQAEQLQKQAMELQAKYQKQVQQVLIASQRAVEQIQKDIEKVLAQVAGEKNAAVVLTASAILFAEQEADATNDFIRLLDEAVVTTPYPDPLTIALPTEE